jgi:hypothetical protein
MNKYKKYKLYNNTLGYYFNLNKKRYYINNFMRSRDNDDYDGVLIITNCYYIAIKIIDDEYINVKKIII